MRIGRHLFSMCYYSIIDLCNAFSILLIFLLLLLVRHSVRHAHWRMYILTTIFIFTTKPTKPYSQPY
jgi:hypothetical protein